MWPFWSAQSAIMLEDPPSFAPAFLLRRLLSKGRWLDLVYAGDRMWPAVPHGRRVRVCPPERWPPRRGDVVLATPAGIPDLLRVTRAGPAGVLLAGDADPATVAAPADQVLGVADLASRRPWPASRTLRRLALDADEAMRRRHDPAADPAATVHLKYEAQAPFYARDRMEEQLRAPLLHDLHARVPPGGRILVAGSGAGNECAQLAGQGWRIVGVDFCPSMIALARSRTAGLPDVVYRRADLREHEEPAGSLDAVVFTYECYSFVPGRAARVDLLRRMRTWIKPGAAVFLSAWRVKRLYDRLVLTVQWLAAAGRGPDGWGSSHTRWIAPDASLNRSYKVALTEGALRREAREAGLNPGAWNGGHLALSR